MWTKNTVLFRSIRPSHVTRQVPVVLDEFGCMSRVTPVAAPTARIGPIDPPLAQALKLKTGAAANN